MDVHLRNLRYFVAVADDLSFSRAADRLHVSQPALSKQIRQLERELRFPLFRRTRPQIELTGGGTALLPEARELLARWDDALVEASLRASEEATIIRVGFQTSVDGGLYQRIGARFQVLRPEWRHTLHSYDWSNPTAGLLDGTADVAFLWLPVPGAERLDIQVVRREPRYVALPGDHSLTSRRTVTMLDLADEPFVALPAEAGPQRDHWLALDSREGRPVRIGAEATTPDETFEAVASGHGVALLAEGNARLYARPGVAARRVEGIASCELALAWRRRDARPAVRDFVQAARDVAGELSGPDGSAPSRRRRSR